MKYCLITFRSVTPAQRGEGILRKAGIDCALGRTPRQMEEQGCGYSLRLRPVDASRGAMLLRQQQSLQCRAKAQCRDGICFPEVRPMSGGQGVYLSL